MSKPQAFQCPNSGASLDYGGADLTIECPYCHTAVIVPEGLRDRKPAAPDVDVMPFFGSLAEQAEKLREVRWLIRTNQQLQAAKLYRGIFGVGLQEVGMAFNDQHELLVVARHQVIKYVVQQP